MLKNRCNFTGLEQQPIFWNSMIDANNITLRAIMKADIALGNQGGHNCWVRQFKDAMTCFDNEASYKHKLSTYQRLDIPMLRVDIRRRHQTVWREVVGQDLYAFSKKAVTYHNWFAPPMRPDTDPRVPYSMPRYLTLALNSRVMRNVSRFRLRGHSLRYETASYKVSNRSMHTCNQCACGENQDEKHVVFNCTWDAIVHLRHEYNHTFANVQNGDLRSFIHQHHVDTNLLIYMTLEALSVSPNLILRNFFSYNLPNFFSISIFTLTCWMHS